MQALHPDPSSTKGRRACGSTATAPFSCAPYRCLRVLGEGTYGVVFEALHTPSGRRVALKQMRKEQRTDSVAGLSITAIRETVLLRELKHPHVVELLDVTHINDQLFLAFELCDTDLRHYLKQRATELRKQRHENKPPPEIIVPNGLPTPFLPIEQIRTLTRQMVLGVSYCHSRRIMHRDLKPQNLLLNKEGSDLKIADLGLARCFTTHTEPNTNEVVTLWYRAPELLLGDKHYTPSLDIWSIGCIIAEMFTGRPLFYGACETETLLKIFQILGTPIEEPRCSEGDITAPDNTPACPVWRNVSRLPYYQTLFPMWKRNPYVTLKQVIPSATASIIDLLVQLLHYNPRQRLTAEQILRHPWFSSP